jgi:putative ABC transport system substrate-binding protein
VDRRAFIAGALALALLGAPPAVEGQSAGKTARVGYLGGTSRETMQAPMLKLREGLSELGWIEGRNLVVEERWADGRGERLSGLADELVRLKVDVIVAQGSPATRAARNATDAVPIVMVNTTDPVGQGFIASLGRPGGNVTGLSDFAGELSEKRLELLRESLPKLTRVAVLFDPTHPAHVVEVRKIREAAQTLGLTVQLAGASSPGEFPAALARLLEQRAEALMVLEGFLNSDNRGEVVAFAARNRIPIVSGMGPYTRAGGLMSYSPNVLDMYRRAATYVDKILKGAKPADLPIEQPTKFELVVNLKTAKALGLTIPPSVLARADEVIE